MRQTNAFMYVVSYFFTMTLNKRKHKLICFLSDDDVFFFGESGETAFTILFNFFHIPGKMSVAGTNCSKQLSTLVTK